MDITISTGQANGKEIRFAELAGVADQPDEADGGPPYSTRYITAETPHHRLPSMVCRGP